MIEKVKSTSFKRLNLAEWEKLASESLRGIPMKALTTETAESIQLLPLYTEQDLADYLPEAVQDERVDTDWTVAQLSYATSGQEFIDQLQASLKLGNEAIVYDGNNKIAWKTEELKQLAELSVHYPIYATNVSKEDLFLTLFEYIPVEKRSSTQGVISGRSLSLPTGFDHIRTAYADLRDIHYDGADATTELAITLARAADQSVGYDDFTTFANDFFVYFSIDTHFFMEIAKLRAFRILWRTFSEAYGKTTPHYPLVLSENSLRSYSKLDPYVNLLRAGNEALSAAIGGIDVLTIHPHNVLTKATPASIRQARNVQLVIKHETYVNEVIDPAKGSFYIERLTKQLVEKAWGFFNEIESIGGYGAYVQSGKMESWLKRIREYRKNQLTRNERSLIGTTIYADLSTSLDETSGDVQATNRLAEPYELLRTAFSETQPKIVLLTFGKLANFKPRADFVSGYLAAGGLTCEWSPALSDTQEMHEWLGNHTFDYAVICASVDQTEEVVNELIESIPTAFPIDIAGNYAENVKDKWVAAGVNGFIYKGQDQLAKLNEIKTNWEGGRD